MIELNMKTFLSDIEIARSVKPKKIHDIAKAAGIGEEHLECYGNDKAKVNLKLLEELKKKKDGKLILVTAISPTPLGEGKTTTTVGLGDALSLLGKKTIMALREPSLGPVFGKKGGATGGGYAQVVPMEDINLHFTGDFHAIGAANNLLAAMLDNHIYQGNELNIDLKRITWRRCVDMNDRQLRNIENGLGGKTNGVPRSDGYDITVASEIMAVLCLSSDLADLKARLGRIIVAYNTGGQPVTAAQLKAHGAMTVLLKDAIKPNLVQTLEHTPTLIHGGPFANIAHGCNSIIATRLALKLGEYVVTEAGFGADLGAEKFFNIKCRTAKLNPGAVVVVATIRALKFHGGADKEKLGEEDLVTLKKGMPNLLRHIKNVTETFGLPAVVAVNRFPQDTEAEIKLICNECKKLGVNVAISEVWAKGGAGGEELAKEVLRLCEQPAKPLVLTYANKDSIKDKLTAIAQKTYGADSVTFTEEAAAQIKTIEKMGFKNLPVCVAKTPYSFSDDPTKLGRPEGFTITVKKVKVSAGAGFVVALTGDVMTMPGLPKVPAAESIDIDEENNIVGLF